MVYKKYIKRGDKKFGPYYYESYRDKNGSIKTRYLEDYKPEKTRKIRKSILTLIFLCFLAIIFAFVFIQFSDQYGISSRVAGIEKSISYIAGSAYGSLYRIFGFIVSEEGEEEQPAEPSLEEPIEEAPPEQLPEEESIEEEVIEEAEETIVEEEIPETNVTEVETEITEEVNITQETNITTKIQENVTEITNITEEIKNVTEINETQANITETNKTGINITTNITLTVTNLTNITITNETLLNITETNITGTNITEINETAINITEMIINITTKKAKIVINRPVKWIKKIEIENATQSENLIIELPKQAEKITIKTGQEAQEALQELEEYEQIIKQADRKDILSGSLTGLVSMDIETSKKGISERFWNWLKKLTITGKVISEQEVQQDITETEDSKIVKVSDIVDISQEQDIAVEYYTQSPESTEQEIENGKQVIISAPSELNYTNVLAYSQLDNSVSIEQKEKIYLYWYNNESGSMIKQSVDFDVYDLDEDGNIDYIEWIVPRLSEQVYEIIYITKAVHLDENRVFIEDIYQEVSQKDGIWKNIPAEHYVRVTFQMPLDNSRDITLYARSIDGCYDNETEILTENGWKLFKDLTRDEHVATLNQQTGELEWEKPAARQVYEHDGEMYRIETEEGDLLVSPEHEVYATIKENNQEKLSTQSSPFNILSNNSLVVNTLTNDCCLRCGSLDQIAELIESANARYGESLASGSEFNDFLRNSLYSNNLKNLIDSSTSFCLILNSCSESLDLSKHSSLYFSNSCLMYSGAKNFTLDNEENKYEAIEEGSIREKSILLSNTSFIFYIPNSLLSLGDSSDNNLLKDSFFALLPKSTDHLINSCSSLELSLLSNSSLLNNSCLISSEKFIQRNLDSSFFNSSSTANVMLAIYNLPFAFNSSSFFSSSILSVITLRATSATFTSGNNLLNFANNSSGTDTVILGILNSPNIYFNTSNYFKVFKSFGSETEDLVNNRYTDASNFSLMRISDVYGKISREEIKPENLVFLDEKGNETRVKSITKENYSGKIYDADVENDIVLVRRKSSSAIWSGNSNPAQIEVYRENSNESIAKFENIQDENWYKVYLTALLENESYDTFDLKIKDSAVEIDYIVDPSVPGPISECQTLDTAGTYILTADITDYEGYCFTITADNVVLDLNGHLVDGVLDYYGISISNRNNVTIKNGTLTNWNYGIYLYSSSNNILQSITASSNNFDGIYLGSSSNNILTNITANSNDHGISLSSSSNNILTNITANSNDYGIYFSSSLNNILQSITASSNYFDGIYLGSSSNNILTNITANSNDYGIYFSSSLNNIVQNSSFSNSITNDVKLATISTNNTFLNTSYLLSGESVASGSELIRKWYYRAFVNDTSGNNVSGANVTAYNVSNSYQFNLTTESTGYTQIGEIIDYINTGTRTYYSNYTIYVISSSHPTLSKIHDVTLEQNILNDNFELIAPGSVTKCGIFDLANTVYTLQNNISTTGNCLTLQANNITIDLNGYNINCSWKEGFYDNYGIFTSGYNLTTIKNGSISDSYIDGGSAYGIYLESSSNNTLIDITANSNYGNEKAERECCGGVYISGSNNNLTNIVANSNYGDGYWGYGIQLSGSNNFLTNITTNSNYGDYGYGVHLSGSNNILMDITSNSNEGGTYLGYGIYLSGSNNNLTNIVAVSNNGEDGGYGIYLSGSNNNLTNAILNNSYSGWVNGYGIYLSGLNNILTNITANSIHGADAYGVYLSEANNTILTAITSNDNTLEGLGGILVSIGLSSSSHNIIKDSNSLNNLIYLFSSSTNNTFSNISYALSNESVESGSQLIRKGYFSSVIANVTYIGNASQTIAGENVSMKNSTGNVLLSNISYTNGQATLQYASPILLTFYTNNGGTRTAGIYLYTTNSTSPYLSQTTDFTWTNLLSGDSEINNEIQDVRMHYSTYTVAGTQTLHDIYTLINDDVTFINLSSATKPCHYVANCSLNVTGGLIIEGCVLEIVQLGDLSRYLFVSGGSLIMNYSKINCTIYRYRFYVKANSNLIIKNSYIERAGIGDNLIEEQALAINTTNTVFYNNSVTKGFEGLVILADNVTINDSNIYSPNDANNIHIYSNGVKIVNCNISNRVGGYADIAIAKSNLNVDVINSNYTNVGFEYGVTGSTLTRSWWYYAFVNDTYGNNVSGANVTAYNTSNIYQFNLTTNSSGHTDTVEIIDYIQNSSGDKTHYSNYTTYARNSSYTYIPSNSINITAQQSIKDVLTVDNAPVVTLISASSTEYDYNVTDGNNIMNCSLILGGSLVETDTTVANNGTTETISYSAGAGTYNYYISCIDALGNIGNSSTSTISITTTTPIISGGGGGGTRVISLKIIVPQPIYIYKKGIVEIPITLENTGQGTISDIKILASIFSNGVLREDIKLELDKSSLNSIAAGKKENITIKTNIPTEEITNYDVLVSMTAKNPAYSTDNTVFLSFVGEDATGVKKMIVFTEETVVGNPECLELREMLDEADRLYKEGKYNEAIAMSQQAIEACKANIEGPKRATLPKIEEKTNILLYLAIGIAAAILFGILFYMIKKIKFRKAKQKPEKQV